jgi:opacity protein-like surface antigen
MRRFLLALALLGALSGCASSSTGSVTGGIDPCSGLGIATTPRYVAGTVTVLKGTVGWQDVNGSATDVFPTIVVAQQEMGVNGRYDFTLAPGEYVLRARFSVASDVTPWVQVTVRTGQALHADITNACK